MSPTLSVSSLPWMRDEKGSVSLSVFSFSLMSGEEGPVSLSVSSLSWMCEKEGPVSHKCHLLVLGWNWKSKTNRKECTCRIESALGTQLQQAGRSPSPSLTIARATYRVAR